MSLPLRKWVSGALLVCMTAGLLAALVSQIRVADILRLVRSLTPAQLIGLFVLYAAATAFRGLRLGMILGLRRPLTLAAISGVHAFLNHVMPFRTGELALPFLVRTFLGRSLAAGAVSLVLVRLYDILSIALLMMVSLVRVHGELESRLASAIGVALLVITAGLVGAFLALPLLLNLADRWLPPIGLRLGGRAQRLTARLTEAVHGMRQQLQALGPMQRYVWLPANSLLTQGCIYAFFYFAMRFMGIDIGFWKNMLASSGELVTGLLPINVVGSIGTLEAGWAAGYVLCGVNRVDAIATGFVVHGLIVAALIVITLLGVGFLLAGRRARAKTVPSIR